MHQRRAVTLYCSSSNSLHNDYNEAAKSFGHAVGRRGWTLVYGAGQVGLMGHAARSCRSAGGRVVGVITERLRDAELMDHDNHENHVFPTMRQRKAMLESRGDALVVLPGGPGTLEEFFEVFVGRLLGEHDKPIVMLNMPDPLHGGGFFDPLLAMFDHLTRGGFCKPGTREIFDVCATVDEVIHTLERRWSGPVNVRPDPLAALRATMKA